MKKAEWRDRKIETRRMRVGDILPHPMNPKIHPEHQMAPLRGLLETVGKLDDLKAYRSERAGGALVFFDGHGRQALDIDAEWDVDIYDLSDAEADLAVATFDPIGWQAEQSRAKLDELLREVSTGNEALMNLLTKQAEEAGIIPLNGNAPGAGGDDFDTTPEETQTRVEYGDLWQCGEHRVLCGDSTNVEDVAKAMGGEKADCVFTSPPYAVGLDYGETYEDSIENLRAMLPKLSKRWLDVLVDGGFAVVNFGDIAAARSIANSETPCEYPMAVEYWPVFRSDGWSLWSRRVWCKPNARVNSLWCIQSNRAATDWEHIWTWKKPGDAIIDRVDGDRRSALGWIDTTSMHGVDVGKEIHGAGMALAIVEWMLTVHSRGGRIVYEPFGGTGTTLIGAVRTGRHCRTMEINPAYVNLILSRWEAETGKVAQLLERANG